jgi:glycosyltransferase involved in cell wall biosynthesis
MNERRKKVLIVLPALKVLGGGEAVAVWMLEALKDEYAVSVLTWEVADTRDLNRVYGTTLAPADFNVLGPPPLLRHIFDRVVEWNQDHYFQKVCLLFRLTQQMKDEFDILISALDEADFGRPGIQYVHYPGFRDIYETEYKAAFEGNGRPLLKTWWIRFKRRCRPWQLISRLSFERVKQNLTLVNSDWTGDVVRRLYGIDSLTVFPPVAGDFPDVPWDQRQDRFVCIGRLVSHKRIEMAIEILAAVRAQGLDVRLQIVGLMWNDAAGRAYYEQVKRLAEEHAAWMSLAEGIERRRLVQLLSNSRYGIHAAAEEPFGIAVAEMVRAGCIAFTGRRGGQAEIIGQDERLMFDSVEEGAAKILNVLHNPQQQTALREHLAARRARRFTAEEFVRRIRDVVRQFPDASPGKGGSGNALETDRGVVRVVDDDARKQSDTCTDLLIY